MTKWIPINSRQHNEGSHNFKEKGRDEMGKKTITEGEILEMLKAGKTISFIPKGELLEYGFCQFGEEDDTDRWCAKDNLCVINLGDKVIV